MIRKYFQIFCCCFFLCFAVSGNVWAGQAPTSNEALQNGGMYRFCNVGSGKYLNVCNGLDADKTNVYQYQQDGTLEQNFRLESSGPDGQYRIRAMCSSSGNNRVLDVVKSDGAVLPGCNIQLYRPVDPAAQEWLIVEVTQGRYKLVPAANPTLAVTAYGKADGRSNGILPSSPGNVFLSVFDDSPQQLWRLEPITHHPVVEEGLYYLRNRLSGQYLSIGPETNQVWQQPFSGDCRQQFQITYQMDGRYKIVPAAALSLALDVRGASRRNDADVQCYRDNGTTAQRWSLLQNENGSFRIASGCSLDTKVLTVWCASRSPGAKIIQYTYNGTANDEWFLERITPLKLHSVCESSLLPGKTDVFLWDVPADGWYVIETFGNTDTYGTVLLEGRVAHVDDDSGQGGNCLFRLACKAGQQIVVKIRHYFAGGSGDYAIRVRTQKAQFYTFRYGGADIDTTQDAVLPAYHLLSLGYDVRSWTGRTKEHLLWENDWGETRLNSEIFFFSGHGSSKGGCVYFQGLQPFFGHEIGDMSNTTVAVWAACHSADPATGCSIAEQSVRKGAKAAIGWVGSLPAGSSRMYTDHFFSGLHQGKTVAEAARSAADRILWPWDPVKQYRIFGDGSARLYSAETSISKQNSFWAGSSHRGGAWLDRLQYSVCLPLAEGGTRYIKTIQGYYTNDYVDVLSDGSVRRSPEPITLEEAKEFVLPEDSATGRPSGPIWRDGVLFDKIIDCRKQIVILKRNRALHAVALIYADYFSSGSNSVYQDVRCIDLKTGVYLDYQDICGMEK